MNKWVVRSLGGVLGLAALAGLAVLAGSMLAEAQDEPLLATTALATESSVAIRESCSLLVLGIVPVSLAHVRRHGGDRNV